MRALLFLTLPALFCMGCQGGVPLHARAPVLASVVAPLGDIQVERGGNFILPRDADIRVAVIAEGHGPQEQRVILALRRLAPEYIGTQALAGEALMPEEARQWAEAEGGDFLLGFYLEQWPGGFVDPAGGTCPPARADGCSGEVRSPVLRLNLHVHDLTAGRRIERVTGRGDLGLQSWVDEDISPLINGILARMLESLAP